LFTAPSFFPFRRVHLGVLLLACSCHAVQAPAERFPCLGIEATPQVGELRFSFWSDRARTMPAAVDGIYVFRTRDGDDVGAICVVQSERPLAANWRYGEIPSGFSKKGTCPSLTPGTFRISVSGPGRGSRSFTVRSDGSFIWTGWAC
jgi:hypothetical protein